MCWKGLGENWMRVLPCARLLSYPRHPFLQLQEVVARWLAPESFSVA